MESSLLFLFFSFALLYCFIRMRVNFAGLQRTVDRTMNEVTIVMDAQESLRLFVDSRLDVQEKKNAAFRTDIEVP